MPKKVQYILLELRSLNQTLEPWCRIELKAVLREKRGRK